MDMAYDLIAKGCIPDKTKNVDKKKK